MFFLRTSSGVTATTTPPKHRLIGSFKCDLQTIYVADCCPQLPPLNSKPTKIYSTSILKSNLQKCIRRGLAVPAAATMHQLLLQDPNEILRRLPIIMCEDTQLCPELFQELVWLMAAVSKGYPLTSRDIETLDNALTTMLEAKERYNLSWECLSEEKPPIDLATDLAFRIRIAYGGMKGDCEFMERLRERYAAGELPCVASAASVPRPEPFDPLIHVIPEAIDFHCIPGFLTDLPEIAKDAIWWNWSSLNCRAVVGDGAEERTAYEANSREIHCLNHRALLEAYAARKIRWIANNPTIPKKEVQTRMDGFFRRI